ncbi:hypothetical protein TNCV_2952291 [Trichonephila clavipes]|nr:hypothetical protein TNCV_2952291 [Trichonephila clavipes]
MRRRPQFRYLDHYATEDIFQVENRKVGNKILGGPAPFDPRTGTGPMTGGCGSHCSKASLHLTLLYPAGKEVNSTIPTPNFGFKVLRMRVEKDEWPNSNPGYVQTEVILQPMSLLEA